MSLRRQNNGHQGIGKVKRKRSIKTIQCHDSSSEKTFHKERGDNPMIELHRSRKMKAEISTAEITGSTGWALVIFTQQFLLNNSKAAQILLDYPAHYFQISSPKILSGLRHSSMQFTTIHLNIFCVSGHFQWLHTPHQRLDSLAQYVLLSNIIQPVLATMSSHAHFILSKCNQASKKPCSTNLFTRTYLSFYFSCCQGRSPIRLIQRFTFSREVLCKRRMFR